MLDELPQFSDIPGFRHVISTRKGGVSTGEFATLNLGYHVEDDPAFVTENRRRLATQAGYDPHILVTGRQVHGTHIAWVTPGDRGRGAFSWEGAIPETDGLIVADPGIPAAILVADCAPVLIVDPMRRLFAVVHAGWRGALAGIASAAVRQMIDQGGASSSCMRVGVGPTLCANCLEVGEEVAASVEAIFGQQVIMRDAVKPRLDIHAMLAADLASVGIAASQITHHPACTRCDSKSFFSHRGQHGRAGRFALVAWWEG